MITKEIVIIIILFIDQIYSVNKGYTIEFWNRCSASIKAEVYNVDLITCIKECGYRPQCGGIQYSRNRKECDQIDSVNKGYTIELWNRCSASIKAEVYNVDLITCIKECGYRPQCGGIQYSRNRKECGIIKDTKVWSPMKVCRNYVIISKAKMDVTDDSCGPYERSNDTNQCITECEVSDNPRNYSNVTTTSTPSVGTKITIVCDAPPVQMTVTCGRNGKFDQLPNCDPYLGQNLALTRATIQSSTFKKFVSAHAVDISNSTVMRDGGCTHTELESRPWLVIELDHAFYLQRVEVLGRSKCCTNRFAEVFIYTSTNKDELMASSEPWDAGTLCAYRQGPFTERPVVFLCNSGTGGQYVKIVLNQTISLELCDVKIYGFRTLPIL